ncbi:MAG TPA: HEAT repeat domain-containing protein [Bryobacteraceae bacterium]|nr:HEAT repeat domain-containing protein [Bryobacteraceae bacterium]
MRVRSVRIGAWGLLLGLSIGSIPVIGAGQSADGYTMKQRISRIRSLARQNDATAIPALTPSLSDPDQQVRLEAVKAIVKIGGEPSLDPLVQATRDRDPEIRIRATDGIVNQYVPGYVVNSGLGGTFSRGARQVKGFFASRNDQVVDPDVKIRPDVSRALADEIGDGASMDARTNAALAAGILRSREAIPALLQGLHTINSDMIFECLVALQKIQDQSAGPGVNFLARDLDERVQETALETIGVLRSVSASPDVHYALVNGRTIKIRRAALNALAMLAVPADRTTFQQYAENGDAELRAAAIEGLGRLREPADGPLLRAAYDEANAAWQVHLAAAFALTSEGKVDLEEFSPLPYLVESLNTKNRAYVANAYLVELAKRQDVRDGLVKLLPGGTKDQKVQLCSIFATTESADVLPALTALSKDIDPDVAFAASRAARILQARKTS